MYVYWHYVLETEAMKFPDLVNHINYSLKAHISWDRIWCTDIWQALYFKWITFCIKLSTESHIEWRASN